MTLDSGVPALGRVVSLDAWCGVGGRQKEARCLVVRRMTAMITQVLND